MSQRVGGMSSGMPLVVQVGFAGSRHLIDPEEHPEIRADEFNRAVEARLETELRGLLAALGLGEGYFLCGISQVAIGADTMFARVCARLGILHRVFLPQHLEEYLSAVDSAGVPDFAERERMSVRALLESPNVIQQRVVSESADRQTRFVDTNLEIARVSDIVVCLVRSDASKIPGGTMDLMEQAGHRDIPLLEIRVGVGEGGKPEFSTTLRNKSAFKTPTVPDELLVPSAAPAVTLDVAKGRHFMERLGATMNRLSKTHQGHFRSAALRIIGAHVLATVCAVVAVVYHPEWLVPLLSVEFILLGWGLWCHWRLHYSRASGIWSMARLVAQIIDSLMALTHVRAYPGYLFSLQMPESLRALRRTLCVLHLQATRDVQPEDWRERMKKYLGVRVTDAPQGQIPYYTDKLALWRRRRTAATCLFYGFALVAMVATGWKLYASCGGGHHDLSLAALAAILCPVIAVAAMSLAASFDLDALVHTYSESLKYLDRKQKQLSKATSEREFVAGALELESQLLGETANWYSRRAFTGVS